MGSGCICHGMDTHIQARRVLDARSDGKNVHERGERRVIRGGNLSSCASVRREIALLGP